MNGQDDIHVQIHDQMKRFEDWKTKFTYDLTRACSSSSILSHGDEWR